MRYRRLTRVERYQISALFKSGLGVREVGRQLGRHASSISRELRLGFNGFMYDPDAADYASLHNRRKPRPYVITGATEEYVREKIRLDWSPEQISGRLRSQKRAQVSYQSIYRYLRRDQLKSRELWNHLRILRKQRKYKRYRSKPTYLENRTPISERPEAAERRKRLGDYERDCVLGNLGGPLLLTAIDRTSRLIKLAWITKKCSQAIHEATVEILKNEPVRTITNDNGTEFARHRETAKSLGAKVYFSNSYRSWERGTNENANGLVRQYFPKRGRSPDLTPENITFIESRLNNRPRKCLGYRTPLEVHTRLKSSLLR